LAADFEEHCENAEARHLRRDPLYNLGRFSPRIAARSAAQYPA
jgi:hypothetical protein